MLIDVVAEEVRSGGAPGGPRHGRARRGSRASGGAQRRRLDLWLDEVKAHDGTRPATLTLYRGLADRYVKPVIGRVRLDKLTPAHVQRLIAETRNAETSRKRAPSAATQRHVHKLIRNALGDALRLEFVTRNAAAHVKAPPMARQRRPDMTIEDARRLMQVIEGERLEAFYVLALTTGLRRAGQMSI